MKPNQISWARGAYSQIFSSALECSCHSDEWRIGEAQGVPFTKNLPKDDGGGEEEEEEEELLSIPMETTREFCSPLGTF